MTPEAWFEIWGILCGRWGRESDLGEAAAYFEYVGARLDEEGIRRAARVVWASREFFPRPIDFLLAANAGLVSKLYRAAAEWSSDTRSGAWTRHVDEDALGLVRQMGGIDVVGKLFNRGPDFMRREIEALLADRLQESAAVQGGESFGLIGEARRTSGELGRVEVSALGDGSS